MKKILFLAIISIALLGFGCDNSNSIEENSPSSTESDYVDLALPSGTLWKKSNESGLYTYGEAASKFSGLPTIKQCNELRNYCSWEWKDGTCIITGRNGNSISMAASGIYDCNGNNAYPEKICGFIWSADSDGEYFALDLSFHVAQREGAEPSVGVVTGTRERCYQESVHLVKTKE